eukprot:TRINITY_DN11561_c0_g2_i8.p2 TRINITY_DN11561_c0_g2~~TRINITY_DN11561_c0_g2_i8.p2  ORF type:complete len:251 (-),score=77.76 TRINITY_DN11561_c0_g2_i8:139-891(-)
MCIRDRTRDLYNQTAMIFVLTLLLSVHSFGLNKNYYDFRVEYKTCVDNSILDRADCHNSWAHAFAGAMSDRLCKEDKDHKYKKLSPKHLTCQSAKKCEGSFDIEDIKKIIGQGIAEDKCIGYMGDMKVCPGKCDNKDDIKVYKCAGLKSFTDPAAIKEEISTNGPVTCIFNETVDHKDYYDGIYYVSHSKRKNTFPTAYKLVGYGLENGIAYWIGEQSLGEQFGENGYVRFKIADELCLIAYACEKVVAP